MTTYTFIDTDTHIGEPADLWTSRVASDQAAYVPRVVENTEKDRLEWHLGGDFIHYAPSGAVAGSKALAPASPKRFEDAHPAAFDPHERLKVMDEVGAWAEVLFPNVGGLGNEVYMKIADPELRLRCVQIYNDHVSEWVAAAPGRFIAATSTPFWDLDATLAEIRRCRADGHSAILFCGKPDIFWDMPHISDPYWNPIWEIATELDMPVAFHIGAADQNEVASRRGWKGLPMRTRISMNTLPMFLGNATTVVDLCYGGVPARYPDVKFVLVESGIGWVPFMLEAMDYQFAEHRIREVSPNLELAPSEYFKRQIYCSFWFERSATSRLVDLMGDDNVMFETDFPHPTSLWPETNVRDTVAMVGHGQPDDVRAKLLWGNAAKLYKIAPPPGGFVLPDPVGG